MDKLDKKIEKLNEKKIELQMKVDKLNNDLKIIDDGLKKLENEKAAYKMKEVTLVLEEKGLNLSKVIESIRLGDLTYIEENLK